MTCIELEQRCYQRVGICTFHKVKMPRLDIGAISNDQKTRIERDIIFEIDVLLNFISNVQRFEYIFK
jgi:hypothetical protein